MKASELKKDHNTSVRASKLLLRLLKEQGMTLQQFLDKSLDGHFGEVKIELAMLRHGHIED